MTTIFGILFLLFVFVSFIALFGRAFDFFDPYTKKSTISKIIFFAVTLLVVGWFLFQIAIIETAPVTLP